MKIKTNNGLTVIRGLTCLSIIWYHISFPQVVLPIFWGRDWSWALHSSGMGAVWIMFILSGYLMGKNFYSGKYDTNPASLYKFYLRRLVRIAPVYYLVVLVSTIMHESIKTIDWNNMWRILTFTAQNITRPTYLSHLWFISVIMQMYLLTPLIFVLMKFFFRKLPGPELFKLIILIVGMIIWRMINYLRVNPTDIYIWTDNFHKSTITNLDVFIFGFAITFILQRFKILASNDNNPIQNQMQKLLKILAVLLVMILFLGLSYATKLLQDDGMKYLYSQSISLPVITALIVGFFIIIFEIFKTRTYTVNQIRLWEVLNPIILLNIIGQYAYEIFLFHFMVIFALPNNPLVCYVNHYQDCSVGIVLQYFSIVTLTSIALAILYNYCGLAIIRRLRYTSQTRV